MKATILKTQILRTADGNVIISFDISSQPLDDSSESISIQGTLDGDMWFQIDTLNFIPTEPLLIQLSDNGYKDFRAVMY